MPVEGDTCPSCSDPRHPALLEAARARDPQARFWWRQETRGAFRGGYKLAAWCNICSEPGDFIAIERKSSTLEKRVQAHAVEKHPDLCPPSAVA